MLLHTLISITRFYRDICLNLFSVQRYNLFGTTRIARGFRPIKRACCRGFPLQHARSLKRENIQEVLPNIVFQGLFRALSPGMVDGVLPFQDDFRNGDEGIAFLQQTFNDTRQGFGSVLSSIMEQDNGAGLDFTCHSFCYFIRFQIFQSRLPLSHIKESH